MLDARWLITFRAVAQAGQISAAARALHLSQPAVSAQVKQLEEQCGVPLLTRSVKGVVPTRAGQELLGYADRVGALLEEALRAVAKEPAHGELVIAASTTLASYVLPGLIAAFLREAPGVSVRLEVGNTDRVLTLVREGAAPLGLVEGLSRAPHLHVHRFLRDELMPVVATDAPGILGRIRHVRDLSDAPMIWREPGSGTRAIVERALRAAIGRHRPVPGDLQIGSTEGIKAAAAAGLGVAFLSRWSVRVELAAGRLRVLTLPDLAIPRDFSFVQPAAAIGGWPERFLRFARLAAPGLNP